MPAGRDSSGSPVYYRRSSGHTSVAVTHMHRTCICLIRRLYATLLQCARQSISVQFHSSQTAAPRRRLQSNPRRSTVHIIRNLEDHHHRRPRGRHIKLPVSTPPPDHISVLGAQKQGIEETRVRRYNVLRTIKNTRHAHAKTFCVREVSGHPYECKCEWDDTGRVMCVRIGVYGARIV